MADDEKPGPLKRAMAKVGIGDAEEGEKHDDASTDREAQDDSGRNDDGQTNAQGSNDGAADGEKDGQGPQNESSDDTADGEQDENETKSEGSDDSSGDGDESKGSDDGEKSEEERAQETMRELEKDPPQDLNEWPGPGDKAMYQTFAINEEGWKGTTLDKLGPSSLRRYDDGSVTVEGEKVDDPDDYKGDPIPGGPTDPNSTDD